MIGRRNVLVAAGGAVVAAGTATIAAGPRRVFHRLGLLDSPDASFPRSGWEVIDSTLQSTAMGGDVRWSIAAPPGGVSGVIVALHGRNDDRRFAFDAVRVHDAAAHLGLPVAVVAADGGASSYWHARSDGTDAGTMVVEELLPLVDAKLGGSLPRALIGWSMGGYGALLLAQRHADLFRSVVASSPALWTSFAESSAGAFDSAEDFAGHDVFSGAAQMSGPIVRVDCGTNDGFVGAARSFAGLLQVANPGSFGDGFHDAAFWRSVLLSQLGTISAAVA